MFKIRHAFIFKRGSTRHMVVSRTPDDDAEIDGNRSRFRIAGMPASAIAFLVLTVVISLLWSHGELLSGDEFGILTTDSVSSLRTLIHVQKATPISLDPIVYHLVAHAFIKVFGPDAFAIRFPSLLGFLTMQICLFVFVRRAVSERAAILAMALTVSSGTLWYAGQGRPYGLLLGLFGLVMVSWQTAARSETRRLGALVTLGLATALALNTHYYAVLILVPLCGVELFRSLESRRIDVPLLLAIIAGVTGIVFALPFAKGAASFSRHYYTHAVSLHLISHLYFWITLGSIQVSMNAQRVIEAGLILGITTLAVAATREVMTGKCSLLRAELVFMVLVAALPFFGYLLARMVTHVIEARFVLGAILGIDALLAIGAASLFQRERTLRLVLAILFAAAVYAGVVRTREQSVHSQQTLATLRLTPETKAAIEARPNQPIFILNWYEFQLVRYYAPDPDMRRRIAMYYSREQELQCCNSDTMTLTTLHTKPMMEVNLESYEALAKQPGDQLIVIYHMDFDWTDRALASSHAKITYLGPAYGGDLVSVRFP